MGNCQGHWNNWNKNDKGKFERNDHKSGFGNKNSCGSCGHHDSDCKCKSQSVRQHKTAPLSDCVLLNSVVCSKKVQKVAELPVPISSLFTIVAPAVLSPALIATLLAGIATISVTPNLAGIVINRRVIRDKVINIGFVPAVVTVTLLPGFVLPAGVTLATPITFNLPFQEHSDCPGACPEDTVIETPFELEATFAQIGGSVLTPIAGVGTFVTGVVIKAIFRTTLTVTRQVIVDGHGNVCDVENRCDTPTVAPNFFLPSTGTGTGTGLGGL
ncbi:hypothetical protein ABEY24_07145 [Peribacillus frigoritolerans]|uniref:hypothetical protein n=1 Tax=Peribacillus frigoritolerans TaxID=450367 RepID=UPI003D26F2AB